MNDNLNLSRAIGDQEVCNGASAPECCTCAMTVVVVTVLGRGELMVGRCAAV